MARLKKYSGSGAEGEGIPYIELRVSLKIKIQRIPQTNCTKKQHLLNIKPKITGTENFPKSASNEIVKQKSNIYLYTSHLRNCNTDSPPYTLFEENNGPAYHA